MTPKTEALIKLLDDTDSSIASTAMSELLSLDTSSDEIEKVLSELQEARSPELRRKTHQMQAILTIRHRRGSLSKRIFSKHSNLIQGLAEIHAIWYDDIDVSYLSDIWGELIRRTGTRPPVTPKRLASFMENIGFTVGEGMQDPDFFCLGSVIEDLIGADALLASIAREAARMFGLKSAIAMFEGEFVLLFAVARDDNEKANGRQLVGRILSPSRNWELFDVPHKAEMKILSSDQVLTYVLSSLLLNAVCAEDARYVQILTACLAGRKASGDLSDILPYPFGKK
jgi:hypothetical protein